MAAASPVLRWQSLHAAAMLLALGGSAMLGRSWPLGVAALAVPGVLWSLGEPPQSRARRLSAANAVTSARLLLVVLLAIWPCSPVAGPQPLAAGCAFVVFALDGMDGWLARRLQQSSAFGARYDMETDACFIAVLATVAWQTGAAPALALLAGALRYFYVLGLALLQASDADAPRSTLGRFIFAVVVVAFTAALAWLPYHVPLVLLANALLVYSFGRSFAWSLRARASPRAATQA